MNPFYDWNPPRNACNYRLPNPYNVHVGKRFLSDSLIAMPRLVVHCQIPDAPTGSYFWCRAPLECLEYKNCPLYKRILEAMLEYML